MFVSKRRYEKLMDEKKLAEHRLNGIVVERDSLLDEVAEYCKEIKRLETENQELAKQLAEADAQLQKSAEEIHGLRMQRTALQLKLDEALKPRARRKGQAVNVGEDGTR